MDEDSSEKQGFLPHLVELRERVIKSLAAVLVCFIALIPWAPEIYNLFAEPLISALPEGTSMIATDVIAPFFVPIKVTFFMSFIITLPYVLWQVWAFVEPALYASEKKLALPIVLSSFLLFLSGMCFAYFIVFPTVFNFIVGISPSDVQIATDVDKYFSFSMSLFLVFGLSFETPVVQMLLVRLDVFSIKQMVAFRPYFVVISFIIAAIVTPPDVVSQFMLALPLCILFQFGILLSKYTLSKSKADQSSTQ